MKKQFFSDGQSKTKHADVLHSISNCMFAGGQISARDIDSKNGGLMEGGVSVSVSVFAYFIQYRAVI